MPLRYTRPLSESTPWYVFPFMADTTHPISLSPNDFFAMKAFPVASSTFPCLLTIVWKVLVTQSCPTLYDPMDCSQPSSFVHGILQARILQWVAISFSRRSSQPRDQNRVSCITGIFYYHLSHQGSPTVCVCFSTSGAQKDLLGVTQSLMGQMLLSKSAVKIWF